jgi:hypothetical protein
MLKILILEWGIENTFKVSLPNSGRKKKDPNKMTQNATNTIINSLFSDVQLLANIRLTG